MTEQAPAYGLWSLVITSGEQRCRLTLEALEGFKIMSGGRADAQEAPAGNRRISRKGASDGLADTELDL